MIFENSDIFSNIFKYFVSLIYSFFPLSSLTYEIDIVHSGLMALPMLSVSFLESVS